MRSWERTRALLRAPKLAWDILVRGRYSFVYDLMPVTMSRMALARRLNLFTAGVNLVHRRLTPWNMPLHMQVELINYCNLRCPVCPAGLRAVNRRPRAIDVSLFERLIDEVGPYLLTISLWAWGEPLLHPRLKDILRAVRKHNILTLLSTNGQNLDSDAVIEALAEEPPAYLIVAIDGLEDRTNSTFRVGAKLAPVLAGVRRLAEIKRQRNLRLPVLHMRYIVMKHNQHELPRVEDFARSNGFEMLSVRTLSIIDSDCPDKIHGQFVPDAQKWRAYGYDDGARARRTDFICQEPFWFPTVFADGTVVACEQDFNAQQSLGSIADGASFASVWFSKRAAEVRKVIRDDAQSLSFCRNCPYCDRTTTDVSVRVHFLNTDIDYPNLLSESRESGRN